MKVETSMQTGQTTITLEAEETVVLTRLLDGDEEAITQEDYDFAELLFKEINHSVYGE